MKDKKNIIFLLLILFITPSFYQNYLYYKIPYNPIKKIPTGTFKEVEYKISDYIEYNDTMANREEGYIYFNNEDTQVFYQVCDYLRSLKLRPLEEGSIDVGDCSVAYTISSYHPKKFDIVVLVSKYNPEYVYIKITGIEHSRNHTNYKIIRGNFDYKYVNDLIRIKN